MFFIIVIVEVIIIVLMVIIIKKFSFSSSIYNKSETGSVNCIHILCYIQNSYQEIKKEIRNIIE